MDVKPGNKSRIFPQEMLYNNLTQPKVVTTNLEERKWSFMTDNIQIPQVSGELKSQ